MARATAFASQMLATISSALAGAFSLRPLERSSRMRTAWPSAARLSARCEPMKPQPPVTR
jgi:hypothetical protein